MKKLLAVPLLIAMLSPANADWQYQNEQFWRDHAERQRTYDERDREGWNYVERQRDRTGRIIERLFGRD